MNCLNPTSIPVLDSFGERLVEGFSPSGNPIFKYMQVACGHCVFCRLQQRSEWTVRLKCEHQYHLNESSFITLTYDNEHLPTDNKVNIRDVQLFFKRLRKCVDKPFKFFLAGEYGDLYHRPHYHALLFGLSAIDDQDDIKSSWGKGIVDVRVLNDNRCNYTCGYVQKKFGLDKEDEEYPLMTCSRRPGLGYQYCLDNMDYMCKHFELKLGSKLYPIPRYFRKIIYEMNPNFQADFLRFAEEKRILTIDKNVKKYNIDSNLSSAEFEVFYYNVMSDINKQREIDLKKKNDLYISKKMLNKRSF